jgi:hypothetical protein
VRRAPVLPSFVIKYLRSHFQSFIFIFYFQDCAYKSIFISIIWNYAHTKNKSMPKLKEGLYWVISFKTFKVSPQSWVQNWSFWSKSFNFH